jgi:golgi SNAP receptor complex member 2
MSISAVFPDRQRLLLQLQHEVNQYESGVDRSDALVRDVGLHLSALSRDLADMEALVGLEGVRKEMWRSRVRQMNDECLSLRASFSRAQQTMARRRHEENVRLELMSGARRREAANGIDALSRENDSLLHSHRMLDDFTAMGQSALDSLHRQRAHLKGLHRRVLDIGNSIGMSSSLLRLIERTETFNACLVATGILVTCTVVGLVWWFYVRGR